MDLKFKNVPEFNKQFRKLNKKYPNLKNDFATLKKALVVHHCDLNPFSHEVSVRISGLGKKVKIPIYKVKKFRSQDFKGKGNQSGFRVIYAFEDEKVLITFLEIYHKNKQSNHSRDIIFAYFG